MREKGRKREQDARCKVEDDWGIHEGTWGGGVKDWFGWKDKGRTSILITGGAGQLGQALIPELINNYTVHIQDIVPRPPSLPSSIIYHRSSSTSSAEVYKSIFASNTFDGVIHLAGISLDAWCAAKEDECYEVNVGGTKALMNEIIAVNKQSKRGRMSKNVRVPWVILGSTMEVFGPEGTNEDSPKHPDSAIGKTKMKAEQVFEEAIVNGPGKESIRGLILRFPEVYGYRSASSIPDAFIPSLLTNSLTFLPIQYSSNQIPYDLLHAEDAIIGFVKAISYVEGTPDGDVSSINLVSGQRIPARDIVELVRKETTSMSPVRDIGDNRNPNAHEYSPTKAAEILSWQAEIAPLVGLGKAITQLTEDIAIYFRSYLHEHCPPSADFPAPDGDLAVSFIEDERNKPLWKLDGCTVNLGFNHEGWIHHLKCHDGKHCKVDDVKMTALSWNQSTFIIEKVEKKQRERIGRVMLKEQNGMGYLGMTQREGEVGFELYKDSKEGQTVFDLEVRRDSSDLRLLVPDSEMQLHAVSNKTDGSTWFIVEPITRWVHPHFDMRINVLCCPFEGDWPLLLDDYESADVRFGSTGQIPFDSTRRSHLCTRAEQAVRYNFKHLSTARQAVSKVTGTAGHAFFNETGPKTDPHPHAWALKDLPACWNNCESPTVCVQTGTCKCVQADHCKPRRENPLLKIYPSNSVHPDENTSPRDALAKAVEAVDWKELLLPAARTALEAHPNFVKVHVADGYKGQEEIEAAPCHKLQETNCFSADSIMYKALRHISVPADEAELVVLPVYQHCTGAQFLLHDAMHHASETIPGVKNGEKTVALVLTHDWGICLDFAGDIWSARDQHALYPDRILDNVLVWSVMGDYDSPCYRPHQDVVVPARTCGTNTVRGTFPNVGSIKPMSERSNLLMWAGTHWVTGKSERIRLTCDRGGAGDRELIKGGGKQSNFANGDYINDLNNARFCPQPRGITGWSPQTNDAIYAGCIPVFIAEGTHYPFAGFLDWSKLSVRVAPTELDKIEKILAAIPLSKVEELQANLVSVREAFLYSGDEKPEEELERRGPIFFALHEAGMRIRTRYPVKEEE